MISGTQKFSLKDIVDFCYKSLDFLGKETAYRESWILIEKALKKNYLNFITDPKILITNCETQKLKEMIERRLKGEPVYRIIGARSFFGREFILGKDTLEPRDDTESLIHASLPYFQALISRNGKGTFLDFGTGSGVIAITLLCEILEFYGFASDISPLALKIAQDNAKKHKVSERFTAILSNGFSDINLKFDAIISNPPYIPTKDIQNLATEVRNFDPYRALNGGEDGLLFYRYIAENAENFLKPKGLIILEIGCEQGQAVLDLFFLKKYKLIEKIFDLQNILRGFIFKKN